MPIEVSLTVLKAVAFVVFSTLSVGFIAGIITGRHSDAEFWMIHVLMAVSGLIFTSMFDNIIMLFG